MFENFKAIFCQKHIGWNDELDTWNYVKECADCQVFLHTLQTPPAARTKEDRLKGHPYLGDK